MRFTQIRIIAKRIPISEKLRGFLRGFITTEELLPLTLEDICQVCPMTSGRGNLNSPEVWQKMDQCRKRYFAALLQSFLGKPGDYEIDCLYSYLKKCESCYLRRFAGAEAAEISIEADGGANVEEAPPRKSQVSQKTTGDN